MTDAQIDPGLEDRVRRAFDAVAGSHQPSLSPPQAGSDGGRSRRPWLLAAAAVLLVGGVGALLVAAGRDSTTSTVPSDSAPSSGPEPISPATTLPASTTPNAAGDRPIDAGELRFAEPLPEGVVGFVNAPGSLPPPGSGDPPSIGVSPGTGASSDGLRFVAMDGPRKLMDGVVTELAAADDRPPFDGPPVDVGVDGARYVDADEGAIVVPVDGGERIVGPRELFTLGGGGPFVDEQVLVETTRLIGDLPLATVDEVEGLTVVAGTLDGEPVDPLGVGDAAVVRHGSGAATVTLYRLDDRPSALELVAYADTLATGLRTVPTVGDIAFVGTSSVYVELVSPVDLLVVGAPGDDELEAAVAAIDFAPLAELEGAFDGTVDAPAPAVGLS